MSQKIFIIIFITLFIFISSLKDEKKSEYDSFNNTKGKKNQNSSNSENDLAFFENPYLILRVAPWTKFEVIQKKFSKISAKYSAHNKTNSKRYQEMKKAFITLEKEYEKNNREDKTFFSVLKKTFKTLLFYEGIMLTLIFITWFVYEFNAFAGVLVAVFVAIDNIIPHWFDTMLSQYVVSLIVGTLIYFNQYLLPWICPSKNDNSDNSSSSSGHSGGIRRRRFEKVEF